MATEENNSNTKTGTVTRTVAAEFSERIAAERTRNRIVELGPLLMMFALIIIMSVFVRGFFTWINLVALLQQIATPLVLAMGLTFVLLLGSIDLSLEGVMGFTGSIVALLVLNTKNSLEPGSARDSHFNHGRHAVRNCFRDPAHKAEDTVIHGDLRDGKCHYRFRNPQLQGDPRIGQMTRCSPILRRELSWACRF